MPGVDFLTTQMFFDNGLLYNFLYRMQRAGMDIPVCAGIMPICDARRWRGGEAVRVDYAAAVCGDCRPFRG